MFVDCACVGVEPLLLLLLPLLELLLQNSYETQSNPLSHNVKPIVTAGAGETILAALNCWHSLYVAAVVVVASVVQVAVVDEHAKCFLLSLRRG